MTRKNNFTRAPEGQPDIEFVGFMDCGEFQRLFKENFTIIQHDGYRTSAIAYYISNGDVPDAGAIQFTVKGDKAAKVEYLLDHSTFEREEIETWPDSDIDSEIIGQLSERPKLSNCDDLNKYDLKDTGIEIITNKNLITLTTCGYSQGDYAKVIYCPDDLEKAWGNAPDQSELQKMFNNLFWDAPYYARMTINGEEYYAHDMPDYNEYEWDSAAFLAYVAKESGIDIAILESFIPQHLEY